MRHTRSFAVLMTIAAVVACVEPTPPSAAPNAGPAPVLDASRLQLALDKLAVVGSVLFIAAHPDDENTAVLTWLESERMVRAGYLSLTRGDGGQNLIGDEQGDLLGVIRTQELLAARRVDGAEQFFTRAVDFGYSTNPEETLAKWGRDEVLSDIVRVIRTFRPDVMIMRFPTTGEGGHGPHTASALLAVEAFEAAGDPSRFPEQLAALSPWRPRRLLWNYFNWMKPPSPDSVRALSLVSVDVGAYNPLLGRSYTELAGESRSMHKSQGFGSPERRGSSVNYFKHIAGDPATRDILEGVDLRWSRVRGGAGVGKLLAAARDEYDPADPEAILPRLLEARQALARLRATVAGKENDALLAAKAVELDEVVRSAAGLWLEAIAKAPTYTAGDSVQVDVTAINRSRARVRLAGVSSSVAALAGTADTLLAENQPVTVTARAVLPSEGPDWRDTQPYWLREARTGNLHRVADTAAIGTPGNPPALAIIATLDIAGQRIDYTLPVFYRWVDRVRGELYRLPALAPAVTLSLDRKVYLFTEAAARPVILRVESRRAVRGTASLALPAGWHSAPADTTIDLLPGEPRDVTFQLTPGASGSPLKAVFRTAQETFTRGVTVIDHAHIPMQTVYPEAAAHVVRLDLARRGDRVGYIMGPGDDVPEALSEAGFAVTLLGDDDLAGADFAGYDVVVVGVRAYNSREALKRNAKRLLEYVREGGTLVVQYNTADATLHPDFAPYSLKLGRDRVTVEEAPVEFLDAASPLLTTPNRITPADFDGWVQERGLYFASEWAPEYQTVLSSADPGAKPLAGGLLVARHGKGVFIYTGYAFFRQLPAGVPGAYRLFVNIVSAR